MTLQNMLRRIVTTNFIFNLCITIIVLPLRLFIHPKSLLYFSRLLNGIACDLIILNVSRIKIKSLEIPFLQSLGHMGKFTCDVKGKDFDNNSVLPLHKPIKNNSQSVLSYVLYKAGLKQRESSLTFFNTFNRDDTEMLQLIQTGRAPYPITC